MQGKREREAAQTHWKGTKGSVGWSREPVPNVQQTFEAPLGAGTQGADMNLSFHSQLPEELWSPP